MDSMANDTSVHWIDTTSHSPAVLSASLVGRIPALGVLR
jgi:hypothetical protein